MGTGTPPHSRIAQKATKYSALVGSMSATLSPGLTPCAYSAVAAETRVAAIAYGSLAANQIIRLGHRGAPMQFDSLYVTVPTAGIVLINHLPR